MRGLSLPARRISFHTLLAVLYLLGPIAVAMAGPPITTASLPAESRPLTALPPIDFPPPAPVQSPPVEIVPTPDPNGDVAGQEQVLPVAPPDRPSWYAMDYWFGQQPWDKSVELGINGSAGTGDAFSIRVGGFIKRDTDWNKLNVRLIHNQTETGQQRTQNNAELDARHDWLFAESHWTLFGATNLLFDEFQAFDMRLALNGGVGYQWIDTPSQTLIGRLGGGSSREFGGPDNRWVPEALFGAQYDLTVRDTQKLYARVDYFPDFADFSSYRLVTDVGWEVEVDPDSKMRLKVSVTDRYDSTPNGADPNLVNYSVVVLWKL